MINQKERCPICGRLLERYPNNGEPLINKSVCLTCNNSIVLPYRYFLSTYKNNSNALLVNSGKLKLIRTSDEVFKLEDIKLYLGVNITLKNNAKLGLTFAFIKGLEEEVDTLNKTLVNALKAPNFKSVMVIPTRLLKGVKMNE